MKEISAIIIDKDPTANEILKQYLEDNSKIKDIKQFLELNEGYNEVCNNKQKLVFIDLAFGEDEVFNTIYSISKNDSECKIVLMAKDLSAELLIKTAKMGAKETILKPIIKKELDQLITKLANQINYNADFVNSKVISIFSNKGGIGKTTIAVNLAAEIADITKEPTVVVDFNSQFGDVTTFLDVKTEFGISYLLNNKEKVSKEFLLSILPQYKDLSLYVLSDLFYLNDMKELTLENVQDILDALKSAFTYIVVDMTSMFDLKTVKILDNADELLFPILANAPSLRNCQRCLDFFKKVGYDDNKIKLILNRYSKNDEIKINHIEETLHKKVFTKLANDYFIVTGAINRGVTIGNVDTNSPIAKSLQDLACTLTSKETETEE